MILPEEGKPLTAAPLTPSWHAEHTPEAPAIVMGATGEAVSYAQLEDRSARLARALRARGLAEGDTVAICMDNNRQYLEVAWAAQRSGLRYTAVNSHLRPAEVQYVLDDSGAVGLVSSQALADVVTRLDLSVIGTLICADGELPGFERYDDVLAAVPAGPPEDEREGREMLYSSGTTGRPKGVRKQLPGTPFGDPASAPVIIARGIGERYGDRVVYLCPAPLYHSAPLVWSMSLQRYGATIVVMEQFDPARCLELIERYRVSQAHDHQRQRLADAGRHRLPGRRRLPLPDRPRRPHDRVRGREHLPPGGRERPRRPPGGGRRGRARGARRRDGRGGQGGGCPGRPGRGRARAGGRADRLLPGRAGVVQVPALGRLRGRAAARAEREAVQTPPA
jgi:hypothetical protein